MIVFTETIELASRCVISTLFPHANVDLPLCTPSRHGLDRPQNLLQRAIPVTLRCRLYVSRWAKMSACCAVIPRWCRHHLRKSCRCFCRINVSHCILPPRACQVMPSPSCSLALLSDSLRLCWICLIDNFIRQMAEKIQQQKKTQQTIQTLWLTSKCSTQWSTRYATVSFSVPSNLDLWPLDPKIALSF